MIQRAVNRIREGNVPDARTFARQFVRTYHKRGGLRPYNTDGLDVFGADWDNLLILDACRYDAFEAVADLPGRIESRRSRGSMTREWVRANFAGKRLHDAVYVTANGNFADLGDRIDASVHAEIPLWKDEHRVGPGNSVAPPEVVAEAARTNVEKYPHKRVAVHFVQPHTPYLGPTGERFDPRVPLGDLPRTYDVSDAVIRRAYRENLELVLAEVEGLLADLPGKTVVTADHGELLGERLRPLPIRDYGHPDGIYMDELVRVPWHVSTNGGRKRVVSEPPDRAAQFDANGVEAHLRDLGYAT